MDFESSKPWSPDEDEPNRPVALLGPAGPFPLSFVQIEHELAPEGSVVLDVSISGKRLSRCAVPEDGMEKFMKLFDAPVPLLLMAFEEDPGIQARLMALVPMERIREVRSSDEPWAASVPSFEDEMQRPEGMHEDAIPMSPVPLGNIVRVQSDRKFPEDLAAEANDLFNAILSGKTGDVIDRILKGL